MVNWNCWQLERYQDFRRNSSRQDRAQIPGWLCNQSLAYILRLGVKQGWSPPYQVWDLAKGRSNPCNTASRKGGPPVHHVHIPTVEQRTKSREHSSSSRIAEFYCNCGVLGGGWSEQSRVLAGCKDLPRYLRPDRGRLSRDSRSSQPGMVRKQLQIDFREESEDIWLGNCKNNFGWKNWDAGKINQRYAKKSGFMLFVIQCFLVDLNRLIAVCWCWWYIGTKWDARAHFIKASDKGWLALLSKQGRGSLMQEQDYRQDQRVRCRRGSRRRREALGRNSVMINR